MVGFQATQTAGIVRLGTREVRILLNYNRGIDNAVNLQQSNKYGGF